MVDFLKSRILFNAIQYGRQGTLTPFVALNRFCHYDSKLGSSPEENTTKNKVAIFWDLDNKPPNSLPPYDAALKLKKAASSFGVVRYMVAYANRQAFSCVPPVVKERRKERKTLNQLENRDVLRPIVPFLCRVCGRKFYTNEKLVNHFKEIHEREQTKRLHQIESARGKMRVKLVARFSMQMEKYKNAARNVLTPKVGYCLADELKRAGFWVQAVSSKPHAANIALRDHMVDMMNKKLVECLVLVSDDLDFMDVLKEARLRCLKTLVVGDINDGALKRVSDVCFSWKEIMMGKAKKQAPTVVGRWKDRNVLKRLEWTYNPEIVKKDGESDECYIDGIDFEKNDDTKQKRDGGAWWKLDSDAEVTSSKAFR